MTQIEDKYLSQENALHDHQSQLLNLSKEIEDKELIKEEDE